MGGEGETQVYLISKSQERRKRACLMCQGHTSAGQGRRTKVQLERREWAGTSQQSQSRRVQYIQEPTKAQALDTVVCVYVIFKSLEMRG